MLACTTTLPAVAGPEISRCFPVLPPDGAVVGPRPVFQLGYESWKTRIRASFGSGSGSTRKGRILPRWCSISASGEAGGWSASRVT